jgi:hypothetical protein
MESLRVLNALNSIDEGAVRTRVPQNSVKPHSEMLVEQRQLSLHTIGEFCQNLGVGPILG